MSRATIAEPESEVLRHRVEESVTRMLGVAQLLRHVSDNLPDEFERHRALRLLADDVEREAEIAGEIELFLCKMSPAGA